LNPIPLDTWDICAFCHKAVGPREPTVEAMRKQYHADCFTCRTCQQRLAGQRYYQRDGRPTCDACYQWSSASPECLQLRNLEHGQDVKKKKKKEKETPNHRALFSFFFQSPCKSKLSRL
uniref:LIM zinc-binding domain-containing protein n=1 Tax=Anas platyrhynchos platyrhynchos TaxID=8840 RepID=A0A493U375_ANAPP